MPSPPPIIFKSPLPATDLLFESMTATSGLSVLGEVQLHLLSEKPDVAPDALLGQVVSVELTLRDGSLRHWSGHCTRFGMGAPSGRHYGYAMTVRPWLWFLTRTSDCRIFQEMTVPDIVKQVFGDHPVAKFEFNLYRTYQPWVYCVQYRESDYNFVARLLEQEGIYWHFRHDDAGHTLVLVDAAGAHDPAPGTERIDYYDQPDQAPPDHDHVTGWQVTHGVQTGKVALTDYDFERPSASLRVNESHVRGHEQADHEVFDYPGEYIKAVEGEQYAETRLDEHQTQHITVTASTNAQGLKDGCRFTLQRHPRDDQNTDYLVVSTRTHVHLDAYESGSTGGTQVKSEFSAIPHAQQFRPPRVTTRPFVQGPQTAVVVGPSGEEIHTDKYGRVKVQFHWDRYGQKNEKSSCWVRVSHPWAGKNFGSIHIPRIGQEVVVSFLEGDPDQPLITGRVYNAEQMPPWDLPANMTQSGILTRSSKGGGYGNANALRFEDKKGAEQVWLHAEKNQDIEVENDETHWVGHDRRKTIDHDETVHVKHDRTETVDNNETITIGVNRREQVGSHETIAIGANRTETVGANESISIGANRTITVGASETATVALQRTHTVGINETIAIGAAQEIAIGAAQVVAIGAMQSVTVGASQSTAVGASQSITVGASQSTDVGAAQSTTVAAAQTTSVGADRSVTVGGAQSTSVAKARSTSVGEDDALTVGKNLVIDAGDSVTIKTGSASITMKKDGTIILKGKNITIDGSGKVNVKASSDIVMKGSKILQN
ncbi:type VI secretion system Vgr family protein [Sphaerotilus sp.]|uniref:type VI secretion system Vgr family protein n=1 Tax=Sphaerotilus sp. TaxID=2093942 RepID=UPI002ACD6ABF|nr:type VI secretion system tip protein TssI/VgrG [Sphaerotilus sp.]MDZ7856488.1 type VI secretion system tip protein TssI/VgrG [Sphaerotilus sp.]